jgi:restriction system protein
MESRRVAGFTCGAHLSLQSRFPGFPHTRCLGVDRHKGRSALPLNETAARTIFRDVSATFAKSKADKSQVAGGKAGEEEIIPGADAAAIQQSYREEIAAKLQSLSPGGFERFCQRLLRESGFQEVTVTGRSGDGGIDGIGILQVNSLVSFKVLFQCKKYQGTVSPMQVRDFRGAMMLLKRQRGLML